MFITHQQCNNIGFDFFCRFKIYDYVQRETVKQKKNTEQQH